ncbi:DNA recombination protein RmuC [Castellaniella sp.]|uniref:DNA recombination protein RmuC n=1 Tax=Castellaniella sp. TaxID=1955812 RepID=UPI0025BC0EDC|nr:DNA recombination protein RmuC [Castellaniella sp.]
MVLTVLIVLVALAMRKTEQAHFKEVIDRLGKLESDKEAAARIGLQMTETYGASKQLVAGFSAIQGQLTDFANGQRVAGDTVTELKSTLPAVIAGDLQKVSTALQELMTSRVLPVLRESSQAMHQTIVEERTAAEKRFNELRDSLQAGQREFTAKSATDFAQRSHELDTKLASYRQEVETKLQANVESVQQLIKSIEGRFTTLSTSNTEAINSIRDSVGRQLKEMRDEAATHRTEMTAITKGAVEGLEGKVTKLTVDNNANIEKLKVGVETKLVALQMDNAAKLEEMRKTVDEKLQATLETRLGESFKLVSERLEQVHRGLGEMQTLASGVGDLKRVLTNVKTRGTWGEMQLSRLLEQMLTAEQYVANVTTKKGSNDRVEFAIRLPGREEDVEVFLPIDAKFPIEDYQRLLDAQDRADLPAIDEAARALETRIKGEARTISEKYIDPPNTTDFALLYLPIEGLYAEVLRRPGLVEMLQHDYRVTVAGPTTLTAILNSLQMGFRTLAITKRSSEVWKVLGAVKTEFGKFGDVIEAARRKLEAASKQFEQVDVRTRAIQRKLRGVEELPVAPAREMLDVSLTSAGDEDEEDPAGPALFHNPGG